MGRYIGRTINPKLSTDVHATLTNFLLVIMGAGLVSEDAQGNLPFSVTTGLGPGTLNPPEQTALSIFRAGVQIALDPINEKFVIDLEAGQTVRVARVSAITPAIT
jgi:hypothetical protein